jgi:hypothetical protein
MRTNEVLTWDYDFANHPTMLCVNALAMNTSVLGQQDLLWLVEGINTLTNQN